MNAAKAFMRSLSSWQITLRFLTSAKQRLPAC